VRFPFSATCRSRHPLFHLQCLSLSPEGQHSLYALLNKLAPASSKPSRSLQAQTLILCQYSISAAAVSPAQVRTGSHEAPLRRPFKSCSEELFPTPNPFADSDDDWAETEDPAGALLGAQLRPIPMSDELEDVFQSMDRLRVEFEELARPAGLPPFGEPLPREDVAVDRVI